MVDNPHGKGVTFTIRSAPVGYAAEYLIFASSAVFLFCRGMVLQTNYVYFNLSVNKSQGGGSSFESRVEELRAGALGVGE